MARRFTRLARLWHKSQPEFNFTDQRVFKLPPAEPNSPEFQAYTDILQAANSYLELAAKLEKKPSFNTQTALYFAAWSTRQTAPMLGFIEQLLPLGYKRSLLPEQPQLNKPVEPELRHLRLAAWNEMAAQNKLPRGMNALSFLQAAREDAAQAEQATRQREKSKYGWADAAPTAGQMRVNTLDSLRGLMTALHEKWLAQAASNPRALRSYLQKASAEGQYENKYFAGQLRAVDTILLAQIKKQVAVALAAHDYDKARGLVQQIRKEYSGGEIETFANATLHKVTQGYKTQADTDFDLRQMKPQTAAYASYAKMVQAAREVNDTVGEGYAQFRLADAAGTMGKYADAINHLNQAIALWEKIPEAERPQPQVGPQQGWGAAPLYYIEAAEYYRGFFTGAGLKQRQKGIALQRAFVAKYPDSKWLEEALWDCLLWSRWSGKKNDEATFARELIAKRPNSIRAENARVDERKMKPQMNTDKRRWSTPAVSHLSPSVFICG